MVSISFCERKAIPSLFIFWTCPNNMWRVLHIIITSFAFGGGYHNLSTFGISFLCLASHIKCFIFSGRWSFHILVNILSFELYATMLLSTTACNVEVSDMTKVLSMFSDGIFAYNRGEEAQSLEGVIHLCCLVFSACHCNWF